MQSWVFCKKNWYSVFSTGCLRNRGWLHTTIHAWIPIPIGWALFFLWLSTSLGQSCTVCTGSVGGFCSIFIRATNKMNLGRGWYRTRRSMIWDSISSSQIWDLELNLVPIFSKYHQQGHNSMKWSSISSWIFDLSKEHPRPCLVVACHWKSATVGIQSQRVQIWNQITNLALWHLEGDTWRNEVIFEPYYFDADNWEWAEGDNTAECETADPGFRLQYEGSNLAVFSATFVLKCFKS